MPLPFAPKPDESKVYQSLTSVLLDDVTASQFDSLRATVYAQGSDGAEDEYRRLLLLALASNKYGFGPIDECTITKTRTTDNAKITIFQPEEHEVWQLIAAGATTSGTSSANFTMAIEDGDSALPWFYMASDDSNVFFSGDSNWQQGLYLTNDVYLTGDVGGSLTYVDWLIQAIRVR